MRFLGLDLGASGLRAYSDTAEQAIGELIAAPSADNRERDTIAMIEQLAQQLPHQDFDVVCLGMSGYTLLEVNHRAIGQAIHDAFNSRRVLITSDMTTAHYSHFDDGFGVTTVMGTGALSFGIGPENWLRIDGLGAALGDFGSAHWIGHTAMRAAKRRAELHQDVELLQQLEAQLGPSDSWPLRLAGGEITTFEIAQAAQVVDRASHTNELAANIMREAGEHAADSAAACANRLGVEKIGYGGSVLAGQDSLAAKSFLARLEPKQLAATPLKRPPGFGAALIARNSIGTRVVWLEDQQLLKRVEYES